ncbi:ubiquitin-specific protease doa4 [Recurvomyces mirabilis]|nr:ubiquitin-specific protease doa4 [Recurvomyces mirabilis]
MSAAAAASPPPHTNEGPPIAGPYHAAPNAGNDRVFEHIDDLKAKATQGYNPASSIGELLKTATVGVEQASNLLSFRRPDLAFVEYVRASEIVLNAIPRHKDYTHFTIDQQEPAKKLTLTQKRVSALSEQFAAIKQIILNNNTRYNVRPRQIANGHIRTESAPAAQLNGSRPSSQDGGIPRIRPTPSPKPDNLHGKAIPHGPLNGHATSNGGDALSERFAKLRTNAEQRTDLGSGNLQKSTLYMPSASDYSGRASFDQLARTNSMPSKPQGPRGMSHGPGPVPPPITIPNFPQAPPAAYSPARNMETTGNIAPPRHSARSLASSDKRRSSLVPSSAASAHAPNGYAQSGDYFPNGAEANGAGAVRPSVGSQRRRSSNMPTETEVSSDRLYDYIRRYHVLLIDFRSREEFDQGHIYSRAIMCVDPLSIRQGMSAEQLLDTLVLSPENEYNMFRSRDDFDFVVYYDSNTASESFRRQPVGQKQLGLKCLHEALCDFNVEKPLRRPPILLKGGLDAWVDMIGKQALLASDTASRVKQGQAASRVPPPPPANGSSELRLPKRRIRDYNPLDADEEQYWREKARAESVVLQQPPELSEEGVLETAAEEDAGPEPFSAIREFNERFPDAGDLDKHAFASQRPSRAPPEVPAKVPMYPSAPHPSQYPQVPARPAPIAPRMSYQGVSDRSVSASQPTSRQASGSLVPYVPPRLLAKNIRLPRTGLVNFSNTCYMNSCIQAMSATTPLSMFLLDDGYKSQLQEKNWKGTAEYGHITNHYANLLRNLWKGDVEVVKPSTFRNLCRRAAIQFDNNDQQDAKEFLEVLIENMHQDMNINWAHTPLRELTEGEEAKRERMPKLIVAKTEWGRLTHREISFIYGLFAGQYASKLTCLTCGFTSTTYEIFTSLSVEIPSDPRDWANGRTCTIDDCLRAFCSEEKLTGDEKWKCPHCRTVREAKKRITLSRAPQFLMVHFKRFASRAGQRSQKIRTTVEFPLTNFSLDPYMLPPPTPLESAAITTTYGPKGLETDLAMTGPFTYDAYAVIQHLGNTLQSGHYITAAKDQGRKCWHVYDDTRVSDFQPGVEGRALQNERAYIVFYQRVEMGSGGVGYGKM